MVSQFVLCLLALLYYLSVNYLFSHLSIFLLGCLFFLLICEFFILHLLECF